MNLAKYSLDNTKIIYFFLAVLLIGGITSFGKLGKKEDAPFVIKSAVIMTRYPGPNSATFITPSAVTTCVLIRSAQLRISS